MPFTVDVTADGAGLVSHAGSGLLADLADRVGLTKALSRELAGLRERRAGHDPGRVIRDLAVMLADGGDCLADLRAVRDQTPLLGRVASDSTGHASPTTTGRCVRASRRDLLVGGRRAPTRSCRAHMGGAPRRLGGDACMEFPMPELCDRPTTSYARERCADTESGTL